LSEFFTSGRAIDCVLVIVALEVLVLLIFRERTGFSPIDVVAQLLAGAMLLLALRLALTGAAWWWTALALSASFPAHLFDMIRRVQTRAKNNSVAQ
jgi:hypothetical protein